MMYMIGENRKGQIKVCNIQLDGDNSFEVQNY